MTEDITNLYPFVQGLLEWPFRELNTKCKKIQKICSFCYYKNKISLEPEIITEELLLRNLTKHSLFNFAVRKWYGPVDNQMEPNKWQRWTWLLMFLSQFLSLIEPEVGLAFAFLFCTLECGLFWTIVTKCYLFWVGWTQKTSVFYT